MSDDCEPHCEVCGGEVHVQFGNYITKDGTSADPFSRWWHRACFYKLGNAAQPPEGHHGAN